MVVSAVIGRILKYAQLLGNSSMYQYVKCWVFSIVGNILGLMPLAGHHMYVPSQGLSLLSAIIGSVLGFVWI